MGILKPFRALALSSAVALSAAACGDRQANEFLLVALGSIGGAVAGSQFSDGQGQALTTAVGAILGAYAAQQALWWMDEQDRNKSETALREALEENRKGERVSWSNPERGTRGYAMASETGSSIEEVRCREFETFVTNGSEQNILKGVACRSNDGSWKVLPNETTL